jgi:hypothetical protein
VTQRAFVLRFLVAAVVSLLLHIALISGGWLQVPARTDAPPLDVNIVMRPTPVPVPPAILPKPRAQPAPRRAVMPPRVLALPPDTAPAPFALPSEPETLAQAEPPEDAAPPAVAPETGAEAPAEPAAPEPLPLKGLPRKGRITYTIYYGAGFIVGRTVQTWEVSGDGYKLASASETTGIVEFFRAQRHTYLSRGRVTAHGLQPETFLMSRTRRGRTEEARARFDWNAGAIHIGKPPTERTATLPADSQDIVSLMYQLALAPPPPGRIRLSVTNGFRFESYDLDVLGEERLETPLGLLNTLPIKQVRQPGAESVELWLAAEYRYLPVKLRFYDREGQPSGEQIVDEIQISEE